MNEQSEQQGATSPVVVIDDPDGIAWDDEADIIIIGFGGAGVVAALEARAHGAEVLVVDRYRGGGATAFSGGILYACGTSWQKEAGFDDTPEEAWKYLSAEGNALSPEALRQFCEGSNADVEWLEHHGVPHGANAYLGKCGFPPEGHYLYYSGNEALPHYRDIARPAPRGHRVLAPGAGGHLHFSRLRDAALAAGVRVIPHAPARRLLKDPEGRVIGIEVRALPERLWASRDALYKKVYPRPLNNKRALKTIARAHRMEAEHGEIRLLRARRGVILANGGFVYNPGMMRSSNAAVASHYDGLLPLGAMGCDGSGIELGLSAGGHTDHMDRFFLGRTISPPGAFVHGVVVNKQTERFINEDAYIATLGGAIMQQPDSAAWLILDRASFWKGLRQLVFPGRLESRRHGLLILLNALLGGTRSSFSLRRLAKKCRLDPDKLEQVVKRYDETLGAGAEGALGKSGKNMVPFGGGPYYALNVSLSNKFGPTFCFSLGGLVVDEASGLVRTPEGNSIDGLYAIGRTAVGLCSSGYMSGLSIADTVFSGRRAGRHAARHGGATAEAEAAPAPAPSLSMPVEWVAR